MVDLPGRWNELRWLGKRIGRPDAPGRAVVIQGEAGVGKTRLVREAVGPEHLLMQVAFPGARFATPGIGLHRLAELGGPEGEALGKELARPETPWEPVPPSIFRHADALLRVHAPTTLVLDDVQWADDLSLAWLAQTGDLLEGAAVTLLLLVRTHDEPPGRVGAAVAPLRARRLLETLTVNPLGLDGVRDMAVLHGLGGDEETVRELHQRSDGLPLVVEEMLRTRRRASRDPTPAADIAGVPAVVSDIVREVLDEVADEGRLLLSACALAPPALTELTLRKITGLSSNGFDAALEQALGSGLLVQGGTSGLAFRHDLQREATQGAIPLAERRSLHRRTAAVLQSEPGHSAAQIAHQLVEAGEIEGALEWLDRAADEALATHDPGSALTYLTEAIRLETRSQVLVRVVEKVTIAARRADQHQQAVHVVDDALSFELRKGDRGRVLLARARLLHDQGRFEEGLEALQEARTVFAEANDDVGLAAVLGALALPSDTLLPLRERIALGREGLALAERSGDPLALARCAGNLAAAEITAGHHRRAFALWRRAMEALDPSLSPEATDEYLRTAGNQAHATLVFGSYSQAMRAIREGLRVSSAGDPWHEGNLRTMECFLLWRQGRWDELPERAPYRYPVPEVNIAIVTALISAVSFERDPRPITSPLASATAALMHGAAQEWAAVAQSLLTRIRRIRREPMPARGMARLVHEIVALATKIGWEDILPATAEIGPDAYNDLLGRLAGLRPVGSRVGAATALAEGLAGREVDLMVTAGEAFEGLGEPYPAAQAFAHAALGRAAQGYRAGDLAVRAASHLHSLGAHRSLSLFLRDAPRARSLDVFRRDAKPHGGETWSLTAREREVAELARLGFPGRQIAESLGISRRTAEKHLEAVKMKLGADRKSDLVRLLAED